MTLSYDKSIASDSPASRPIVESGVYNATLKAVKINQNDEYELDWDVYNGSDVVYMRQWLNMSKGFHVHHLKCLAKCFGAIEQYEAGSFDPRHFTGRNSSIRVTKKEAKNNPGQFRNWIDEIIVPAAPVPPAPPTTTNDTPF
jgi:hypothetical protein